MRHFTTEEWADFARGVTRAEQNPLMKRHLQDGCRECAKLLNLWQRLQTVAQRQTGVTPPDGVVRIAKAAFRQRETEQNAEANIAEVLFDSFLKPLQAGVRSSGNGSRQLLYGAGSHRIDVRVEPDAVPGKFSVMGQVLDAAAPERLADGLEVRLLRGEKVIAETQTNRFGEFHFETVLTDGTELRVKLANGQELTAVLARAEDGTARQAAYPTEDKEVKALRRQRNASTRKKV